MRSARLSGRRGRVFAVRNRGPIEARAVGVPAGTSIDNTAQVTYTVGSVSATATSNTSQRDGRGDPRRRRHAADAERAGHRGRHPAGDAVPRHQYRQRAGDLPAADDQRHSAATNSIPSPPRRLSTSTPTRSGDLSPGDTPYVAGSNDPVLNADAFVTVLVVNDIPAGVADGNRGFSRLHGRRAHRRRRAGHGLSPARAPAAPTRWSAPPAPTARPPASTWSPASR